MLDYVKGGLLFDTCQLAGALSEETGRYFMSQFIDIFDYLHNDQKVTHRDLKLDNILVDTNYNLVLADFGYAKYTKIDQLSSYKGSIPYMAPEIQEDKIYDGRKADIFGLGVVMYVIVRGTFPFLNCTLSDMSYKNVCDGEITGVSEDLRQLLTSMMSYDPKSRPTITDI